MTGKEITIVSNDGTERRIHGDAWLAVNQALTITDGGDIVAEFAPGGWAAVIDEAHRVPDAAKHP